MFPRRDTMVSKPIINDKLHWFRKSRVALIILSLIFLDIYIQRIKLSIGYLISKIKLINFVVIVKIAWPFSLLTLKPSYTKVS